VDFSPKELQCTKKEDPQGFSDGYRWNMRYRKCDNRLEEKRENDSNNSNKVNTTTIKIETTLGRNNTIFGMECGWWRWWFDTTNNDENFPIPILIGSR
jgi:hypothetical protein